MRDASLACRVEVGVALGFHREQRCHGVILLGEKDALPRDDRAANAARWKISLKAVRRWRQDGEGPVWHKLFHHVRYHEADILEFERQDAQHWQAILGERERVPRVVTHPPKADGDDAQTPKATLGALHGRQRKTEKRETPERLALRAGRARV
ncbi:MAG TPA: hypothetical protein VFN29_13565 [Chiayiivirga sp.]|nr:hypothetical protein [Chiayiivirga sp.]